MNFSGWLEVCGGGSIIIGLVITIISATPSRKTLADSPVAMQNVNALIAKSLNTCALARQFPNRYELIPETVQREDDVRHVQSTEVIQYETQMGNRRTVDDAAYQGISVGSR